MTAVLEATQTWNADAFFGKEGVQTSHAYYHPSYWLFGFWMSFYIAADGEWLGYRVRRWTGKAWIDVFWYTNTTGAESQGL